MRCNHCALKKSTMVYLRLTTTLCTECYIARKELAKSLVAALPEVEPKEAPLGYRLIVNSYFTNERHGKLYAEHVYEKMEVANS